MLNFQEMIANLIEFWAKQGCIVHQGYDLEVGAGTFNPATFLRCQGPEPYSAVYVEPSRRPKDGRYGENPNRVQFYHQMQVILKPSPSNLQDLYLKSLEKVGLKIHQHDIRFVHDDWENPTIGAWGLGWEVWVDGMEITQFTYFQAVGGIPVCPVSGEITYGLERLAMYIQGVDSLFDLKWNDQLYYGDIYKRSEWEWSHYNFHEADTSMWLRHFEDFEREAKRLAKAHFPIPSYDFVMKASHAFNILDARGVISVTERTGYIARIRQLARLVSEIYIQSREKQDYPLLRHSPPFKSDDLDKTKLVEYPAKPHEKETFLLEIGSEEIPATFVPLGMASLEKEIKKILETHALPYEKIQIFGTPKRLAVLIEGLQGGTSSQLIERKGPSLESAFDVEGKPTKSAEGFFRSMQLRPMSLHEIQAGKSSALSLRKIKETDYLFAMTTLAEKSTRKILAEELSLLIVHIDFPKKMRWANLEIEYARPLRWIVALYGSEVIPFTLGDLSSDRKTYGHWQLSPSILSLNHASDYVEALKTAKVMVNVEERRQSILSQIKQIENETDSHVIAKERVMPQVLHLVEWPMLTLASFDPIFLKAPQEVLISEMVEHQKYFPITTPEGTLKPNFVIVCNNTPSDMIRRGNQKALAPRIADGLFLYEEDLKIPLMEFNNKLKSMTYFKELGSVFEKVNRLAIYCQFLHDFLPIAPLEKIQRAAFLCKADLASHLVGEFPELQGIVGSIYARHHGEDSEIAQAIDEHWMPKGEKASLPQSACGILLCIAEKIDNLLSCFSLGFQPTSSSDPYALRRQALAIIRILIDKKYFLPLEKVLRFCFEHFIENPSLEESLKTKILENQKPILDGLIHFFSNRLRTVFQEMGFEKDEIESTLSCKFNDIYDAFRLISALHEFRKQSRSKFAVLLEIHTRVKKILLSQNPQLLPGWLVNSHLAKITQENRFHQVNSTLLQTEAEKELFITLQSTKSKFYTHYMDRRAPEKRDYFSAFGILTELQPSLATLFDSVKILDENREQRMNRLALLQEVWDLCEELVDFSKIQQHS